MSKHTAWVQTYTGKRVSPFTLDPATIDIIDIAHSLAMQCRFNGHIKQLYSVAQHSINASYLVHPSHALEALLHDAAEYLIGDLARPIKQQIPSYAALDDLVTAGIAAKYRLDTRDETTAAVKLADNWLVIEEARIFLKDDLTSEWGIEQPELEGDEPRLYWEPIPPDVCRELFLLRFEELWAARSRTALPRYRGPRT